MGAPITPCPLVDQHVVCNFGSEQDSTLGQYNLPEGCDQDPTKVYFGANGPTDFDAYYVT